MNPKSAHGLGYLVGRIVGYFVCLLCFVGQLTAAARQSETTQRTQSSVQDRSDLRTDPSVLAPTPSPSPSSSPTPCIGTLLAEDFENSTLGLFISTSTPVSAPGWSTVNTAAHGGSFSAFAPDINVISDQQLTLINPFGIPANASSAVLAFWHRFDFEGSGGNFFDGGVLETSTDGGKTWQDAGPNIIAGGYNGTISSNFSNPLAGRMAWGQNPNGTNFAQVLVNLLPYAGQNLLFRFREGTDVAVSSIGWWVDDIHVDIGTPCGTPTPTPSATASTSCAPLTLTGAITLNDPTQMDRLFRGNEPTNCGAPNTCSSLSGTYHYRSHTFVNTSSAPSCITTKITTECEGSNAIFAGAYLESFDPTNICTNNIGDTGMSPTNGSPVVFGYDVPSGATFVIVVAEVTANAGCEAYTVEISGLPCPTPTPGPAQALNISTRLRIDSGNNVAIGGFIITGTDRKTVAIRGIGPSLSASGVSDALADPTLELRSSNGVLIQANDNWQDEPLQEAQLSLLGLGLADADESGLVASLDPNAAYTAVLSGKNGEAGVGLIEIYDTDSRTGSHLSNISTRGFVLTGDNVIIGGFILRGSKDTQVAVRGLGPSLAVFGLSPVLYDPVLQLHDSEGTTLEINHDWQDDPSQATQLLDHGLGLPNGRESGIFQSLAPGAYTVILAGDDGGTGIGLIEVYNLQ